MDTEKTATGYTDHLVRTLDRVYVFSPALGEPDDYKQTLYVGHDLTTAPEEYRSLLADLVQTTHRGGKLQIMHGARTTIIKYVSSYNDIPNRPSDEQLDECVRRFAAPLGYTLDVLDV